LECYSVVCNLKILLKIYFVT